MVPGGTEISLNYYNSRNICHSELQFYNTIQTLLSLPKEGFPVFSILVL